MSNELDKVETVYELLFCTNFKFKGYDGEIGECPLFSEEGRSELANPLAVTLRNLCAERGLTYNKSQRLTAIDNIRNGLPLDELAVAAISKLLRSFSNGKKRGNRWFVGDIGQVISRFQDLAKHASPNKIELPLKDRARFLGEFAITAILGDLEDYRDIVKANAAKDFLKAAAELTEGLQRTLSSALDGPGTKLLVNAYVGKDETVGAIAAESLRTSVKPELFSELEAKKEAAKLFILSGNSLTQQQRQQLIDVRPEQRILLVSAFISLN
ncbi:MAG: hypothetical protein EB059_11235 [Alphaproteobacteria bacterium]|nr:hypothetical protein [Alphaproteobacteria bacterium]